MLNVSLWESVESLDAFTHQGKHALALQRREQWFDQGGTSPRYVLYWIPKGHVVTENEVKERLEHLGNMVQRRMRFPLINRSPLRRRWLFDRWKTNRFRGVCESGSMPNQRLMRPRPYHEVNDPAAGEAANRWSAGCSAPRSTAAFGRSRAGKEENGARRTALSSNRSAFPRRTAAGKIARGEKARRRVAMPVACSHRGCSMNVTVADPAQIVLQNLGDDDRRKVWGWIDTLKRWDSDSFVQQHSKKLDTGKNEYMLITPIDLLIFFSLQGDSITVLDVARKSTILRSRLAAGADPR